jgi:hypothetical protein
MHPGDEESYYHRQPEHVAGRETEQGYPIVEATNQPQKRAIDRLTQNQREISAMHTPIISKSRQ